MEDDPYWKSTLVGRRPLVGRWPSVKHNLRQKMTFVGKWPLVEDNLPWKTTFCGKLPLMKHDLRWKTTFDGRRPLVEDNLQWKMTFVGSLHAAYSSLWHSFNNQYQHFGGNFLFFLKMWGLRFHIQNLDWVGSLLWGGWSWDDLWTRFWLFFTPSFVFQIIERKTKHIQTPPE